MLTRGAALDPAARDRFVSGIREAMASRSGMWGWMARAARGRTAVADTTPQVLAMDGGALRGWSRRTSLTGRGPSGSSNRCW
ncbi:hypothetical protein ACFQX6_18875 [Streptosporangium lutulentum]